MLPLREVSVIRMPVPDLFSSMERTGSHSKTAKAIVRTDSVAFLDGFTTSGTSGKICVTHSTAIFNAVA